MVVLKTPDQQETILVAGSIIKRICATLPDMLHVGMETIDIDRYVHQAIVKEGGTPSFLGYGGFPASCCVSINDEIIHGKPSRRVLCDGDIVSVDVGVQYKGGFADSAHTFYVGTSPCPTETARLLEHTKTALTSGVCSVKPRARIADIARAIYAHAQEQHLGVVREYCGHGVGLAVHEPPEIPNYYPFRGQNARLREGMVIAIEPMFSLGSDAIIHGEDRFTVKTADGSLSAHFEHTVIVTSDGYSIAT